MQLYTVYLYLETALRVCTVPDNVHRLTRPTTFYVWKTRGCQCSFRLL